MRPRGIRLGEIDERPRRASGCALLLDVNNVHVSARNLGFDAADLRAIARWPVLESRPRRFTRIVWGSSSSPLPTTTWRLSPLSSST